jgi:hypothetical protein
MGKEDQRELLLAMSYAAHQEAHKHLSEAGREVLEMMEYTSRYSGLSIADAYVEASATASLSERDKDIISRRTLRSGRLRDNLRTYRFPEPFHRFSSRDDEW